MIPVEMTFSFNGSHGEALFGTHEGLSPPVTMTEVNHMLRKIDDSVIPSEGS